MNVFKCGVVLTGLVPSSFKMFIACCQFICNVSCPKFYLYKILDRVYLHRFLFFEQAHSGGFKFLTYLFLFIILTSTF